MLGISVSVSTVNLNRAEHDAAAGVGSGSGASPRSSHLRVSGAGRQRNISIIERDEHSDSESGSLQMEDRRNSYSLMSLHRLRKLRTIHKKRMAEQAQRKHSAVSAYQQRVTTPTESAYPTRLAPVASGPKLLRPADESDEGPHRPSKSRPTRVSRCSEFSAQGSLYGPEQEQGEQPAYVLENMYDLTEGQLELDELEDHMHVLWKTRLVVALASSLLVICYCALCGLALCEIEFAYRPQLPVITKRYELVDSLLEVVQELENVTNVNISSLRSSLALTLEEHGLLSVVRTESSLAFDTDTVNYGTAYYIMWTAITTVGYGNLAPLTWPARLFIILTATFGIPLFLINATHLANLTLCTAGELLGLLYQIAGKSCKFTERMRTAASKDTVQAANFPVNFISSPFAVFLLAGLVTVTIGFIFSAYKTDLDTFNVAYFSYITLTTIGFGDIVLKVPDAWTFLLYGPLAMTGIGLYAFWSDFLRFRYLHWAKGLVRFCKHTKRRSSNKQ